MLTCNIFGYLRAPRTPAMKRFTTPGLSGQSNPKNRIAQSGGGEAAEHGEQRNLSEYGMVCGVVLSESVVRRVGIVSTVSGLP